MTPTWTCDCCHLEGDGLTPDQCPECEQWDITTTQEGYVVALRAHEKLISRARSVAEMVLEHVPYDAEISFESTAPGALDGGTFNVKWDHPACARGCCGTEYEDESVPFRYLGMTDVAIRADLAEKKAAEAKKKAEAEKAKALKEAQAALERAASAAATAQAKADEALAKARAELSALTWRSP